MRRAPPIRLHAGERRRLRELAAPSRASPRVARRARIVLRAADGASDASIAQELRVAAGTVALWRRRFLLQRVAGLEREAPRSGRPPKLTPARIQEIVRTTLGRKSPSGGPWSSRSLAAATGVSRTTIERIWRAHQIEPRRAAETLRRNPGAKFVDKVTDLVGLYFHPPDRAMAFSVDEKGTTSALPALSRRAIERFEEDRRALEFRAFLQAIDRETPAHLDVHLLLDGRLAPTNAEVRRWLGHHPRFYLHFLPADRTGPNLIDRWWAGFSRSRPTRTSSPSVVRLHRAFRQHFATPPAPGRAFVWTATAEEIRGGRRRPGRPSASPSRTGRDGVSGSSSVD